MLECLTVERQYVICHPLNITAVLCVKIVNIVVMQICGVLLDKFKVEAVLMIIMYKKG